MVQFKNFELKNSELIFGGEFIKCKWTDSSGGSGDDLIDTVAETVVYY